jgi:hypothetical protein
MVVVLVLLLLVLLVEMVARAVAVVVILWGLLVALGDQEMKVRIHHQKVIMALEVLLVALVVGAVVLLPLQQLMRVALVLQAASLAQA